jgi:hypothetical protein
MVAVGFTTPPSTLEGLTVRPDNAAVLTVRVIERATPRVAVRLAFVVVSTGNVVIVNVPVDEPAATFTLAADRVPTAAFERARGTDVPSLGAGPVRSTVPVTSAPPNTTTGLMRSDLSVGACTVKVVALVELR